MYVIADSPPACKRINIAKNMFTSDVHLSAVILFMHHTITEYFPDHYLIQFYSFSVSAQILKASLDSMERQIQRLENDIQNFPKTDDKKDKFVEKMSISLTCFFFVFIYKMCIRVLYRTITTK